MVPGVPSGDRGNWVLESLRDRSLDACFAKKAYERLMQFRAFPERVDPRILSLERFDKFGTSEHFSGRKKRKILIKKG